MTTTQTQQQSNTNGFKGGAIRGSVKFANLKTPKKWDEGQFKFIEDQEEGSYNLTLLYDNTPENKEKLDKITALRDSMLVEFKSSEKYAKALEQLKKFAAQAKTTIDEKTCLDLANPVTAEMNKENEFTGKLELRFKRNAKNKKGETVEISFADRFQNPINEVPDIGKGSDVNVGYFVYDWVLVKKETLKLQYGITLGILGVQCIKLKASGAGTDWMQDFSDESDFDSDTNPADVSETESMPWDE